MFDPKDEETVARLALDAANERYNNARKGGRSLSDEDVREIEKYMGMRETALGRIARLLGKK